MDKSIEYYLKARKSKKKFPTNRISSMEDAYGYAKQFYSDDLLIYESVFIMMLDRGNKVKAWAKISQGGIIGTVVDVRIICKYAIDSLASGIIMIHNHPTGSLKPSNADISVTRKLKDALALFEIDLLDHLIITDQGYKSIINQI